MVDRGTYIEVLVEGVVGEGPRRVRRGRQDVLEPADGDDVGRVAAAGALGMVRVDRAFPERGDRRYGRDERVRRRAMYDIARYPHSTNPDSLSVSVWMFTYPPVSFMA
jgi:hypothetical protein